MPHRRCLYILCSCIVFALPVPLSEASVHPAPVQTGKGLVYSVIEVAFTGPDQGPGDSPARDIDLLVRFRHESGAPEYLIYGFWDGDGKGCTHGNVFKVRFCPTKSGKWVLAEVRSNHEQLRDQHQGDWVLVEPSSLHGFWEVDTGSPGRRWYRRSDGSHQYVTGNTMYSFLSETYLDGRPNGSCSYSTMSPGTTPLPAASSPGPTSNGIRP